VSPWTSRHLYLHGGTEHTDRFLAEFLAPAADRLVSDEAATGWFFMRYWTGGPHVRFRVRAADPSRLAELLADLPGWLADNPSAELAPEPERFYGRRADASVHGWHPHGSVIEADYEPEYDRYGGPAALPAAEELFVASSQIAIAAIRGSLAGPRRMGVAYNLVLAFAHAVCENEVAEVAMLRRYVYSARYNTDEAPELDLVAIREHAERDFGADPDRYRRGAAAVHALIEQASKAGYLGYWSGRAADYASRVRELAEAGKLTSYASPWTVLLSQLHMLMNRIGITLPEEYQLSWLASLVSAGATVGEGYHGRGMATPARRLHEESKYFAGQLHRQLPRSAPSGQAGSAWPLASVPLPNPAGHQLARPSLTDCLANRRSSLAKYLGPVPIEDLSALLHHAAGEHRLSIDPPAGSPLQVAGRPYPTAGGLHASQVLVLPVEVPGLEPAIYAYQPAGHQLNRLAPAPSAEQLAASSPYFEPAGAVAIDATSVPLWLFVTGDIAAITARYGLRGYRFLLLEAGHLSQNLVLLATALGYRSVTIGGFYDDALSQLLELDGVSSAPLYAIPVGHG
ncbi:MAG: thiopeptide-type bacteriocin biosynthesis protein, partial [Jatrophihabitantaceae bacterium]